MLRTNARITPLQAVLRYRDLIQVEALFKTAKSLMRTRPIYHSSDAAIRGHVFCSFLALILRKELDTRCRRAGLQPEWGDVLRDLDRLQEVEIDKAGRRMTLRTPSTGVVGPLFKAVPRRPAAQRPGSRRSLTITLLLHTVVLRAGWARTRLRSCVFFKNGVEVEYGSPIRSRAVMPPAPAALSEKSRLAVLLEHFATIDDPRDVRRITHPLAEILLLVVCGTIADCDDYDHIAAWGEAHLDFLRRHLPYDNGVPGGPLAHHPDEPHQPRAVLQRVHRLGPRHRARPARFRGH